MANNFKRPEQRKHWNEYNNNYAKKNYKSICMKISKTKDADIIEYLENNGESPTVVFKKLIREKIGSGK